MYQFSFQRILLENIMNEINDCLSKPKEAHKCLKKYVASPFEAAKNTIVQEYNAIYNRVMDYITTGIKAALTEVGLAVSIALRELLSGLRSTLGIDETNLLRSRCLLCQQKSLFGVNHGGQLHVSQCGHWNDQLKRCPDASKTFKTLFTDPSVATNIGQLFMDVFALLPALAELLPQMLDRFIDNKLLIDPLVRLGGDLAFLVQFFLTTDHLMDTFRDLASVFDDFESNINDGFAGGTSLSDQGYAPRNASRITSSPSIDCPRLQGGDYTNHQTTVPVSDTGVTNCPKNDPTLCGCDVPDPDCELRRENNRTVLRGAAGPYKEPPRPTPTPTPSPSASNRYCPSSGLTPPVTRPANLTNSVFKAKGQNGCEITLRKPLRSDQARLDRTADAMGLPAVPVPNGANPGRRARATSARRAAPESEPGASSTASGVEKAFDALARDVAQIQDGARRLWSASGNLPGASRVARHVQWRRAEIAAS